MKRLLLGMPAFVVSMALVTAAALGYPGQQYAKQARITIDQARSIVAHVMPSGKIVGEELEREAGGSGLRYSFDVKAGGKTYEVGVDAKTGAILEKALEGASPD